MHRYTAFAAVALAALGFAACEPSAAHNSRPTTTAGASPATATAAGTTPASGATGSTQNGAAMSAATAPSTAGSRAAFRAELLLLHPTTRSLGRAVHAALRDAGRMSNAQIAATFGALSAEAEQVHETLLMTAAPASERPLLDAYAADFGTVADDLSAVAETGISGDAAAGRAAARQLVKDAEVLVIHSTALRKAVLGR